MLYTADSLQRSLLHTHTDTDRQTDTHTQTHTHIHTQKSSRLKTCTSYNNMHGLAEGIV